MERKALAAWVTAYGPWLVFVLAALAPLVLNAYDLDVAITILTFAMLGLGLNIVVGYAGLLDLGYAAFFAIGAYTTALLSLDAHFTFWETLPLAIALAAVAGVLIGYPTLRLRSDYLAIVTLGFGEIVRITATNLTFTGGPNGLYNIPSPALFGFTFSSQTSLYYLGLAFLLFTLFFVRRLANSRLGRAWLSLREDESASEAVGVPSVRVKLLAYVFGAMWAGLAGAYFAGRIGAIDPTSFTYQQSVNILMVVVLGGMGSIPGMVLGAMIVIGLPEALRSLQLWRLFVFAIGLIVLMLLRPQGLWPAATRRRDPFARLPAADEDPPLAARPGTPGEPLLVVTGLDKRFGGVAAVRDVSFTVRRGEVFSIIGPNGAGKTTVFNCIMGVVRADRGSVRLGQRELKGLSPHRVVAAGLARTFQGIRLFRAMAVFENVLVGMYVRQRAATWESALHTPRQRREELEGLRRTRALLSFVGLADQAGRLAGELSYGDQRRLEIARALASEPVLLLLDEPAAGMNPSEKVELMTLLAQIRDLGVTVLLIEHDMDLVMRVSDRILVMDQGAVIAEGTPAEVRQNPAVIAAYLGEEDDEVVAEGGALAWDS